MLVLAHSLNKKKLLNKNLSLQTLITTLFLNVTKDDEMTRFG